MNRDMIDIDANALVRFASGESSLEEMALLVRIAAADDEVRDMIEMLEKSKERGRWEEPVEVPMESMAAASEGNLCDILCEQYILRAYYPEITVSDTLEIAMENAWIRENGTPLHNVGRLLERYGWLVSRGFDRTLEDLSDGLRRRHHAIAVVDSGALWKDEPNGLFHAVVVLSVSGDIVRLWDPASDANANYPGDVFDMAWRESRRYLVMASSGGMDYTPRPADVSQVELDSDLLELGESIAENVHEVWAQARMREGWKYGEHRDDIHKLHPDLVPYSLLPESEKNYDRNVAFNTLRIARLLGFEISRRPAAYCPACGESVKSTYAFCPNCGLALDRQSPLE